MFRQVKTGKILYFEKLDGGDLNRTNILHLLNKYTIVTFNGNNYDLPVIEAACQGFSNESLKEISDAIIGDKKNGVRGLAPWQVRKQFGIDKLQIDHIDLIEVSPLSATLKIYAGRLGAEELQDLPFEPSKLITREDADELVKYCKKDVYDTELLLKKLIKEINLRVSMSNEYKVDLRSKSDAQIAEEVIKHDMEKYHGLTPKKPSIESGTEYYYKAPDNLVFESDVLNDILRQYTTIPFTVGESGHMEFNFEMNESDRFKSGKRKGELPDTKKQMKFMFDGTKYTVGVGGLHSNEKSTYHESGNGYILRDYDVASYYPNIILNNRLYPKHIGEPFLSIYGGMVKRRLKAKREGNKTVNESLKITINGLFGKLGSKYSILYSPDLMMQVTITGQLSLLMLIERLVAIGVKVVSANTDGIVTKFKEELEDDVAAIIEDWEFDTKYDMESADYCSLNSRDVNNYIAVKEDGCKGKGAYADQTDSFYQLRKNPESEICTQAVKQYLIDGTPIEETIHNCKDILLFCNLRTVNGGAVKDGEFLGKAIRWYYGRHELDAIHYSTSGNKVPKSDGGVPLMSIPDELPDDIDYEHYINESYRILKDIGRN
jgi:hypothetical protein